MNPRFDDAMIDRCCLYLFGEMAAAEVDEFQRECTASVELRECLSAQAELVSAVGIALAEPLLKSEDAAAAEVGRGDFAESWFSARGAVAAAVALAATLLLWVGVDRDGERGLNDTSEATQLAQAWAAERWREEPWNDAGLLVVAGESETDVAANESTIAADAGPPRWLVVAVRTMDAESTEAASEETRMDPSDPDTESADANLDSSEQNDE